ncbi:SUMF1/EgtB/PvdO family nonheme iron enzyme [Candidatus Poribacteria bacterium]|nr:SUMF1/EgtB/PvdO family nonheme iron enzyme [Candidatus Poribacteria bacterium]
MHRNQPSWATAALCFTLFLAAFAGPETATEAPFQAQTIGRGDGRSHIITSISPRSPARGAKVTLTAFVKSSLPVAAVTASLDGETVAMKSKAVPGAGVVDEAGSVGMFETSWLHGETSLTCTPIITVRDVSGHEYSDWPPGARRAIAGNAVPGSDSYPDGGMRWLGDMMLAENEADVRCMVFDPVSNALYLATDTGRAIIVKVDLATFTRVGAIQCEDGEGYPRAAILDEAGRAAYFAMAANPGRIVKIDLDTFTRAGGLMLPPGEENLQCAAFDPATRMAYFGTSTSPGRVVKVNLATFERVGSLLLDYEENDIRCAVIDPSRREALFGTSTYPARIVKVNLDRFERVGALKLWTGSYFAAVMDVANDSAYFCSQNGVQQIRLDRFSAGAFAANADASCLAIEPARGELYVGDSRSPGHVRRFTLPALTAAGIITTTEEPLIRSVAVDSARGRAYFATVSEPSRIMKVNLDNFTRSSGIKLGTGDNAFASCALDAAARVAYFGTYTRPGRVVKMDMRTFQRIGALDLQAGDNWLANALMDPVANAVYFATDGFPGRLIKIDLATFTRVAAIDFPSGEGNFLAAGIDVEGRRAYLGTNTGPQARVVKIDLTSFTRQGSLTLATKEELLDATVIDPVNKFGYFGTFTSPGRIIKVNLTNLTHAGAITLPSGGSWLGSASIDVAMQAAYFNTYTSPGYIVKINLNTFAKEGSITLPSGAGRSVSSVIDFNTGTLFVSALQTPPVLSRIDLGTFAHKGSVTMDRQYSHAETLVSDPETGHLWFGTRTYPARVGRVAPYLKGVLLGSRLVLPEDGLVQTMHFFSHRPDGNLRMALYDNGEPRNLLWQSPAVPNTATDAVLAVPISDGSPASLRLSAGTYWLAWQSDAMSAVGSYARGPTGDGFSAGLEFGPVPDMLASSQIVATDAIWTQYITYSTDGAPSGLFVTIPAGTFTMGNTEGGDDLRGTRDELPRHDVTLSAFRISDTEVMNSQYAAMLNWALAEGLLENRDGGIYTGGTVYRSGQSLIRSASATGRGTGGNSSATIVFDGGQFRVADRTSAQGGLASLAGHPVSGVTWYGAAAYCNFLALSEGKPVLYDWQSWELTASMGDGVTSYRLPTEAEWERAAAWDATRHWIYGFASDTLADTSRANHKPKGGSSPNPLGLSGKPLTSLVTWYNGSNPGTALSLSPAQLYDASGNVWEWCHDRYSASYYVASPTTNPMGDTTSSRRAIRGGGWKSKPEDCRTANRQGMRPTKAQDDIGFRIVAVGASAQAVRFARIAGFPTPSPTPTPTPTPVPQ